MKKLLIIALLSALNLTFVNGQKIKRDLVKVYSYDLPNEYLPVDVSTYSVKVIALEELRSKIHNGIKLAGFDQKDADGQIKIEFKHYPLRVVSQDLQVHERTTEKDGVKKTTKTYSYNISYEHKALFRVLDWDGNVLIDENILSDQFRTTSTGENPTSSAAAKRIQYVVNSTQRSELESAIGNARNMINARWGFVKNYYSYPVFNIKPKKYDYDEYNEASAKVIKVIESYSNFLDKMKSPRTYDFKTLPDSITSQFATLENAINVWEGEVATADYENRRARIDEKIVSSTLINIALCQFVLGQYDKSISTLDRSTDLKGKDGWANVVKDLVERVKADKENFATETSM